MREIDQLINALSVGSYNAPGQLVGGSALQVEDLEVTMRCVTFECAKFMTSAQFNRFLRRLDDRLITYTVKTHTPATIMSHNKIVTVGEREFLIRDTGRPDERNYFKRS